MDTRGDYVVWLRDTHKFFAKEYDSCTHQPQDKAYRDSYIALHQDFTEWSKRLQYMRLMDVTEDILETDDGFAIVSYANKNLTALPMSIDEPAWLPQPPQPVELTRVRGTDFVELLRWINTHLREKRFFRYAAHNATQTLLLHKLGDTNMIAGSHDWLYGDIIFTDLIALLGALRLELLHSQNSIPIQRFVANLLLALLSFPTSCIEAAPSAFTLTVSFQHDAGAPGFSIV